MSQKDSHYQKQISKTKVELFRGQNNGNIYDKCIIWEKNGEDTFSPVKLLL